MRLNPFTRTPASGPREREDDYGFGEKVAGRGVRLLDKHGEFNVERRGARTWFAYQWLIEMSWPRFFLAVLAYYVAINLALAALFYAAGPEGITGLARGHWAREFAGCFFFSVQTFTTVGYGSMAPVTLAQQLLAGFGALVGLMSLALATGLFFARFSRPRQRVVFSERAVISTYADGQGFMFRIASRSSTKLINVHAEVVYSWVEVAAPDDDAAGQQQQQQQRRRRFYSLPLERDHIAMLPLNWTIVHPITGESPLLGCDAAELRATDGEFIVQVRGYDQTYARQVYAHTSYRASCIDFGRRFAPMYAPGEDGRLVLHLDRIDDTEPTARG